MSNITKGLLASIISAVLFGLMPLATKFLYSYGLNTITVVFFRQIIALPVVMILLKNTDKVKLSGKDVFEASRIIIFGMLFTQIMLYASYNYISTGLATTLHYIYPTFVVIGMVIFYKAKMTWVKISCVLLCTVGIILFYEHVGQVQLNGMLIALGSGLSYAYYLISLSRSNIKFIPPMQYAFLYVVITSVAVFIYGMSTRSLHWFWPIEAWLVMVVFSITITIIAVLLVQYAVKFIEPEVVSIVSTLEPITSIIIGALYLNEIITIKTAVGMVCILSAVVIISIFTENNRKKES